MALPEDNLEEEQEDNDFFDVAGDVLAAPFRGIEGAFQGAYNLADYLAFDVLPDYDTRFLGTSKTMAGGAVEGISQFATGFIPLFGLAGRAGALAKAGTATKAVVAGAATDFTFFNGQEARLSNLIQQVPELQNPVTEFLAYDGDESELEGRMKNVLEGLGLEAMAGVFIKSVKAMKKARKVKEETGDAQKVADSITEDLAGEIAAPTRDVLDPKDRKLWELSKDEFENPYATPKDENHVILYHRTNQDNIDKIKQEGLKKGDDDVVWLTEKPDTTYTSGALIEVEVNKNDLPDFNARGRKGWKVSDKDIRPDQIKNIHESADDPLMKFGGSYDALRNNPRVSEKARRRIVEDALERGEKVPESVLKDFPDLLEQQKPRLEFAPKPLPEYKPNKQDEFLNAVPEKFRGYAEELMKGGKPRLPQFALETGEDAIVLKELTEKYYEANPEKLTVADAVKDVDEDIRKSVEAQAEEGQDIEKTLLDIRITQQSYADQGEALIKNISDIVKEFDETGGGTVSVAKLKNAFQQMLVVHDVHRRIGRGTAQTLQARRTSYGKRKIGINETETGVEGIRNEFVNNSGNMKPERMIKLVKEHIDPNDPKGSFERLFNTAKKAQGKHFLDMPTEYWMNSILSGPKTQMVNIMGNALTQVWTTLEAVAGGVASGNMDVVKAVLASWSDGEMFKEAAKFSKQAFKEQDNLLDPSNRAFEEGQRAAITGQRLQEGPLGNIVSDSAKDSIDKYAQFIRLPSRLLLTSDEFFKQLAYRRAARLKAAMSGIQQGIRDPKGLAAHITKTVDGIVTEGGRMMSEEGLVREAGIIADKKGLKGKDKADFIIKYKDDNFNPDSSALMQYAAEEAQYLTFTKELQDKTLGKVLQEATNKLPYLRLVIPFVRTPTNILKFAFERTPFVVALKEERQKLFTEFNSPDPILRARARGKAVTAGVTMGALMDVAFNNREYITGGGPSNEREKQSLMATGWRPYSIKIGDTYYSYQRLDPLATPLGVIADIVETGVREEGDFDESWAEHWSTSFMLALTRNATNKSYLAGIQMWADALGDPDRYVEKLGRNYAGSLVPNLISQMSDYDTQAIKEARSVADVMKKKLGLRGSLDTKRNVLGEEYVAEQWMSTGFINPIQLSTKKGDPVLTEMASLNHAFRQPQPQLGGQIDLLEYENERGQSAHDRRLELLKTVKMGGLTLRQSINKLIKSRAYQRLSPESEPGLPSPRIGLINSLLTKYRKEALRQTLREYPELDKQYSALTRAKAGFKTGMQREDVLALLSQ